MPLKGKAKRDYQRRYMAKRRASGSNKQRSNKRGVFRRLALEIGRAHV